MKSVIVVVFLVSLFTPMMPLADSNTDLTDADLKELILGKWSMKFGSLSGVSNYRTDGILEQSIVLPVEKEEKKFEFMYSWDIQNKKLVRIVIQSDWQQLIPSGRTTYDNIIELNSERLVILHEDGEETIQVRIK